MKSWNKPSPAAQAAAALILIQLFFKLLFEIPNMSMIIDRPLMLPIVYILTAAWVLLIPLCLAQVRLAFLFGSIFGFANAALSLVMLITGRSPAPSIWQPFFVTVQNVMIVYFCYLAYQDWHSGETSK